jgi:hypothetical protein
MEADMGLKIDTPSGNKGGGLKIQTPSGTVTPKKGKAWPPKPKGSSGIGKKIK